MEVRPAEAIALPVPRPAVLAQDLVWPLLVALATAAAIAPFWASELLPYQDGPQHAALPRLLQLHRVHPARAHPPRAHRTRAATTRSPAGGRDGHRWRRAPLAASQRACVRTRRERRACHHFRRAAAEDGQGARAVPACPPAARRLGPAGAGLPGRSRRPRTAAAALA